MCVELLLCSTVMFLKFDFVILIKPSLFIPASYSYTLARIIMPKYIKY